MDDMSPNAYKKGKIIEIEISIEQPAFIRPKRFQNGLNGCTQRGLRVGVVHKGG